MKKTTTTTTTTKQRGRPRADPFDPTRYERALSLACDEVGLPHPNEHALTACPRCAVLATPAQTVMHLATEHGATVPQSAARILVRRIIKDAKKQETKTR